MSDAPREHKAHAPPRLTFAIVAMSDSRAMPDDRSGALLVELVEAAGHRVVLRTLVKDEPAQIRASVATAVAAADVLLLTGGTGLAPRDVTPETVAPLFEKRLPGFGEIFRLLSYQEIGSAAMASRADAGVIQGKLVFLLPGSPKACRLAMEKLVLPEAPHLVGLLRR